jgi:hypothetical protein
MKVYGESTFIFLRKDCGVCKGDNHRSLCVSNAQLALQTSHNVFGLEVLAGCKEFCDN